MTNIEPAYDSCCLVDDELVALYLQETPSRISSLREACDQQNWEALQRLSHQIKGSAASYGFPEISTLGLSVESAIKNGKSNEEITAVTQSLIAALNSSLGK